MPRPEAMELCSDRNVPMVSCTPLSPHPTSQPYAVMPHSVAALLVSSPRASTDTTRSREARVSDLPAPSPSYPQQERLTSEPVKEGKAEDGSAWPKHAQVLTTSSD